MAGHMHFAAIGDNLLAVWTSTGGGLMAQIDNLARAHAKPVKLLWSMPMPQQDADAVIPF